MVRRLTVNGYFLAISNRRGIVPFSVKRRFEGRICAIMSDTRKALGYLALERRPLGGVRAERQPGHQGERAFHGGNRHHPRRAGQGARSVRFGRQAAARGHRPHLGLRLHSGRRDPLQGPGAHPALQVLVRSARRRRGEPPHLHRRGRPARGVPALRRLSARSLHASEEGRHVPRRVHRARVSGW